MSNLQDRRSDYQRNLPGKTCRIKYTKTKGICINTKEITGVVRRVTNHDVFIVLETGHNIPGANIYEIEILD